MNLLLFEDSERTADGRLILNDRRFRHLRQVLAVSAGDEVRVGQIDGQVGRATVQTIDQRSVALQVVLTSPPPAPLPLSIVLALPRPKMLRRLLRAIAEVGVKELHLINSFRVEKSFWQSPLLAPAALRDACLWGLEQASDTRTPSITLHQRFRPFAEDRLPALIRGRRALLAAPGSGDTFPSTPTTPGLLVIGPEGGFIPFENTLLEQAGCSPVSLGERVLRVETALQCALGRYLSTPA